MTDEDDEQVRREHALRQLLDRLAVSTEHEDITKLQAYRKMLEAAIVVYDGTENRYVADWARDAIRDLDERGL
jgi:hypothetical protein